MKGKYWYAIDRVECPICGWSKDYRERMYTPKPESVYDRIHYATEAYHCGY